MTPHRCCRIWVLVAALVATALGVQPVQAQRIPSVLAWQEEIRGSDEVHLRWPVAVAAASVNELVVADAFGSRLVLLRNDELEGWEVVRAVGLPGTPQDLVFDAGRYVVSLRQGAGIVAAEGAELRLRKLPLPKGSVPGSLSAHPAGGLLVWDAAGRRVLSLDSAGALRLEVAIGEDVTALAAAADGGFFTTGTQPAEVRRYAPSGDLRHRWPVPGMPPVAAWPSGLTVRPDGSVVVVDRHNARLVVLDRGGSVAGQGSRRGWVPGLLRFPRGISTLPDGRLAVADQGNGRIQIFRAIEEDSNR
ncbi:MAG: hypothetical protein GY769_25515 [bacterium]|nr:hypothetical protein [bacterium]